LDQILPGAAPILLAVGLSGQKVTFGILLG